MEWMYKANNQGVNSEEYLLGRKVDSAILDSQNEEKEEQGSSGAVAIDMANKIREDPLFAIKQREANKRKALLENPIRLKQLQRMLQSQVGKKSKMHKKKRRKNKREKKQRRSSSDSSASSDDSDDDDLDAKLIKKLRSESLKGREEEVQAVLKGPHYGLIRGRSDPKPDSSRNERSGRGKNRNDNKKRQDDDEFSDSRMRDRDVKRQDDDEFSDSRRRDRDVKRQDDEHNRRKEEDRDVDYDRHNRRHDEDRRRHADDTSRRKQEERRDKERHKPSRRSRSRSPVKEERKISKLSDDEIEKRRREMMDNAKWRDEQRKTRVEHYKVEAAKEDETERKKSKKADFFNPLKVTSNSSVEDRIKRNIHSIQRTKADLDKNFAKR